MNFLKLRYLWPLFLVLALFASALIHKAMNINYNTPLNDEAIYIVVGQMSLFRGGWEGLVPFQWVGGVPYFYSFLTAIASSLGGIEASRLINVGFFTLTLVVIYKIAQLLYPGNKQNKLEAGLIAAFVLGFASVSYYVARIATYDMPSYFFLSLGILSLLLAERAKKIPAKFYFMAAICLVVAFFFKYVAGIFLPLIIIYSYLSARNVNKKQIKVWRDYFLMPLTLGIGGYVVLKFSDLYHFYTDVLIHEDNSTLRDIWETFIKHSNVVTILWGVASIGFFVKRKFSQWAIMSVFSLLIVFSHLLNMRESTLDKHIFLTVMGFSVMIGIGAKYLIDYQKTNLKKNIYLMLTIALLAIFFSFSFELSSGYNSYWKNSLSVHEYLNETTDKDDIVLSEVGAETQLVLIDTLNPVQVNTFDFISYGKLTNGDAIAYGLQDGYFDTIVLETQRNEKLDMNREYHDLIKKNFGDLYKATYADADFSVYKRKY